MNDKAFMIISYYKSGDMAGVDFCDIEKLESYVNDNCTYKGFDYPVEFSIYTISRELIDEACYSVQMLIDNATLERTIKIDNPVAIYEKLDNIITKKIVRYVRYSQRHAEDDYWRGKLAACVMIAKSMIVYACLDDALYEIAEQSVYADKIRYSSYNLGFSNACISFINRARLLTNMPSNVYFDAFRDYNTDLYVIDYYDNDGDLLMFEKVHTLKDAIRSALSEMYSKDNLDASDKWHLSKAIVWHEGIGNSETIEDVHSFKNGIGHYMSVIESL